MDQESENNKESNEGAVQALLDLSKEIASDEAQARVRLYAKVAGLLDGGREEVVFEAIRKADPAGTEVLLDTVNGCAYAPPEMVQDGQGHFCKMHLFGLMVKLSMPGDLWADNPGMLEAAWTSPGVTALRKHLPLLPDDRVFLADGRFSPEALSSLCLSKVRHFSRDVAKAVQEGKGTCRFPAHTEEQPDIQDTFSGSVFAVRVLVGGVIGRINEVGIEKRFCRPDNEAITSELLNYLAEELENEILGALPKGVQVSVYPTVEPLHEIHYLATALRERFIVSFVLAAFLGDLSPSVRNNLRYSLASVPTPDGLELVAKLFTLQDPDNVLLTHKTSVCEGLHDESLMEDAIKSCLATEEIPAYIPITKSSDGKVLHFPQRGK